MIMNQKPNPELVDDENPEWTDADFARAVPFSRLPPELRETLASARQGVVVIAEPGEDYVAVPLPEELVAPFRATGPGWQGRLNAALKDWLGTHSPDDLQD
jgi:uncharacterized protein (DUF4415 family)